MKFERPATQNPIDQLKVIGKPVDRIEGRLKTTGAARYAYERHDVATGQAYGYVVGSAIAKGSVAPIDITEAAASPGVIAIVTAQNAGPIGKTRRNPAALLGGPAIDHYHQAIALVVAETGIMLVKNGDAGDAFKDFDAWARSVEGTFDTNGMTADEYVDWLRGPRDDLDRH